MPAGALPLYEAMAVLGEASAEQEAGEGSDAEEPPQLATILEQVFPCEAAHVSPCSYHMQSIRWTHQQHHMLSSNCEEVPYMMAEANIQNTV